MANGLLKRNKFWSYDFWFKGKRHQGSTRLSNHEKAKLWLSAYRTNLAMTGVGLVQRESPPILGDFLKGAFLDSVKQSAKNPATLRFYTERINRLTEHQPFKELPLDKVTEISIQNYADARLKKKLAIATINAELRCLRTALLMAWRCKLCDRVRVVSLPGEHQRTFVLSGEMENAYLAVCPYPLKQAAILMLDLGLRPSECMALRKGDVCTSDVTVRSGKTQNARRALPQTQRTREVFKLCAQVYPDSPWVFPGLKGQHYSRVALGNLHVRVRTGTKSEAGAPRKAAAKPRMVLEEMPASTQFPVDFILHSLRHTFATRLAESGASAFDICKLMGHSSIKVSQRYIHIGADHLSLSMKRKEAYDKLLRGEESSGVPAEITTLEEPVG